LTRFLAQRDKRVLQRLKDDKVAKKIINALDDVLASDRNERNKPVRLDTYLHVTLEDRETLQHLAKVSTSGEFANEAERLINLVRQERAQLANVQRKIDSVPDAQSIAPIAEEIKETKTRLDEVRIQLAALDMELARLTRERDSERAKWVGFAENALTGKLESEDARRIISHSQRVRQTLDKFRVAVGRRHVVRIQQLILDSFQRLIRKKTLVSTLRLDPEQFSLQLYDFKGGLITPDRLSAGERQLLAVSILWGLARASGRPLPTVIDTPLGRLDTSHRRNLVERYFPYAAHQVLLLSTDEEINTDYHKNLRPWTGHSYFLDYDDEQSKSIVRRGYFH
jgi:DNA sulfur modification protein DndD